MEVSPLNKTHHRGFNGRVSHRRRPRFAFCRPWIWGGCCFYRAKNGRMSGKSPRRQSHCSGCKCLEGLWETCLSQEPGPRAVCPIFPFAFVQRLFAEPFFGLASSNSGLIPSFCCQIDIPTPLKVRCPRALKNGIEGRGLYGCIFRMGKTASMGMGSRTFSPPSPLLPFS